ENWPEEEVQFALDLCHRARQALQGVRERFERVLSSGAEARSLRSQGADVLAMLRTVREEMPRLLAVVKDRSTVSKGASFRSEWEAAIAEISALFELTGKLLDAVTPPLHIDWEKVRAAEEAFARGETRPASPGFMTRPE